MKKVLSILVVMMVVMASVFATSGDKLWITSTVTAVPPVYAMYGLLTGYPEDDTSTGTLASGTKAESTLEGGNIATGDIDVYVKVYQTNSSTYLNASGVTISVEAKALKQGGTSEIYKVDPTVEAAATGQASATTNLDNTTAPAALASGVGRSFLPKYLTGAQVPANVIGTIQFHYEQDATLPPGSYEAEIVLTYTTS